MEALTKLVASLEEDTGLTIWNHRGQVCIGLGVHLSPGDHCDGFGATIERAAEMSLWPRGDKDAPG